MTTQYDITSLYDKKNVMKEIIQEIVLCGLSRGGFFNHAAFYGGSALRIFYGLDRFSEDLDFSLISSDPSFMLSSFFPAIEKEAASYGLKMEIKDNQKSKESPVKSASVKGNTKELMLLFYRDRESSDKIQKK